MNSKRPIYIAAFMLVVAVAYAVKLYQIQVSDSGYKEAAAANVVKKVVVYPQRGLIHDRNGELIVYNQPVIDIMVTPAELPKAFDTTRLISLLNIDLHSFEKSLQKAKEFSWVQSSPIVRQISTEDFTKIQDQLIDFQGFHVESRTVRSYPHKALALVLGYIGEISGPMLERPEYSYYSSGDYIGISGLEAQYEEVLRGKRGVKYELKNVQGITKGKFEDGTYDTAAIPGENLQITIDIDLQKYGEKLLKNKRGSIVAIEPSTGEILAFVSSPSYDPNLLTGRSFASNFDTLQKDPRKPLFNRALQSQYPPGSIFKLFQALVGMDKGFLRAGSRFLYPTPFESHGHHHEALHGAIRYSSNPYFYHVFKRIIEQKIKPSKYADAIIGMKAWVDYAHRFGFGRKLGVDIPNERPGLIPDVDYYNKIYGEMRWKFSNIYSLSIGQGEISTTPLQMANLACIIANKGYYISPHFVKNIGIEDSLPFQYKTKHYVGIDSSFFDLVIPAMKDAVRAGTVTWRAKIDDIDVCGKTGTAQNPHGDDHSIFTCFAPMDNPKIAVGVIVENGGFGGVTAAPIATFMIEKYLKGETDRKEYEEIIINKSFEPKPAEKPVPIAIPEVTPSREPEINEISAPPSSQQKSDSTAKDRPKKDSTTRTPLTINTNVSGSKL